MKYKIILIFIIAFLIRLIALNQSLWLDEAITANVVRNFNFFQIVTKFSPTDFHPPLYYLLMKLWTNVFGYSEIALRLPSIIFSLLIGYVVYRITGLLNKDKNNSNTSIWAMIFFLFNPLIIYYSQEARMYMMATFFVTSGLYYFLESQKLEVRSQNLKSKVKSLLFMNFLFILSFYTFYGSIFLIIPMMLYLLFKKQYKFFFVSCFMFLISFAIVSPLLYQQFIHSKVALANVSNWSLVLGKANIKNLLLIPIKFTSGRISFEPKYLYYIVAGGWSFYIFFSMIKNLIIENYKLKIILVFLFICPLVLGFIASFFVPMLQYFRFIYLIPILSILLASHKIHLRGGLVASGLVIFSLSYLLFPHFHREDWRSLVKSIPKNKPVFMVVLSSDPVNYYSKDLLINELTSLKDGRLEKDILVIPYTADIYGINYQSYLIDQKYSLKAKQVFNGLELESWGR